MKAFNQLIQAYFGELSHEELEIVQSYFYEEKLKRNDFYTLSGKVCDRLSIIKSGVFRIYTLADGKEITQWISHENQLITEVMGFFYHQPNRWNIQALSDVSLLTINKANYLKLCESLPKWNTVEKRFIVKCFAMLEDRVFSHISMTAEERYDLYYIQNQELFNQVPLQYIASVLGMSAETLSRIRKRKSENS
ncbi:Crp/Fnr family transcriptional regulator [uncultured Cyclobacterium sp.]|uniref:Crp/Fnr family transcriptional regulator n=1 Tax=uncultured Cyclobacterium sp. TaxID=453820 RepID=UPI0030EE3946